MEGMCVVLHVHMFMCWVSLVGIPAEHLQLALICSSWQLGFGTGPGSIGLLAPGTAGPPAETNKDHLKDSRGVYWNFTSHQKVFEHRDVFAHAHARVLSDVMSFTFSCSRDAEMEECRSMAARKVH